MTTTPDTPLSPPHEALTDGILFKLDLGCWTGSAQLDAEDLGLDAAGVAAHYHLGRKRLVAKDTFKDLHAITDRTKYLLERLSTPLPDGGRFVARAAVPEVVDQLHVLRQQFLAATDVFLERYPAACAAMRSDWEYAAHLAYKHAGTPGPEEAFVAAFLARVDDAYPAPAALARKFRYVWYTYQLTLGGLEPINADGVSAEERIRRERDQAYAAEVHARIERALDDSMVSYRTLVAEAFQGVLDHLMAGRTLTLARVERLRRTIERFRKLDVFGDAALEQTFRQFEQDALNGLDVAAVQSNSALRTTVVRGLAQVVAAATTEGALNPTTGRLQRRVVLPTPAVTPVLSDGVSED